MGTYARTDVLVDTDWVAHHLDSGEDIRLVEADEDVLLYNTGHIPGAVKVDWHTELQDAVQRDFIDEAAFARLCEAKGIGPDTTVVFYGDKNNWWACYAFWVFRLYGHAPLRVMDGGREKWQAEGRPLTTERPDLPDVSYPVPEGPDLSIRAFRDEVLAHQQQDGPMVDVRSPEEFRGEITHLPGLPEESSMRGGHIPGARNVPWSNAVAEDGTFKPREELESLYQQREGLNPDDSTIAYCRIGERSSHTWFVLKYLLGFDQVKNYDGSWTEWGNLVGMPIEKGEAIPATETD